MDATVLHNETGGPISRTAGLFFRLSVQAQKLKPTPAEAPVAPPLLVTPTLNDDCSP